MGLQKRIEIEKNKAWEKLREKKIAYYNIYMDPDKKEKYRFLTMIYQIFLMRQVASIGRICYSRQMDCLKKE